MSDPQAEVVDHVQHAQSGRIARTEVGIHVRQRQAGIVERPLGALGVKLGYGLVRRLSGRMFIGAGDAGAFLDAHRVSLIEGGRGRRVAQSAAFHSRRRLRPRAAAHVASCLSLLPNRRSATTARLK
ncbi:hypothetical protein D9M68_631250 [compost metagenome]